MNIRYTVTSSDVRSPYQATPYSAGYDLYANRVDLWFDNHHYLHLRYYAGLCVEIPIGFFGMLAARSSVSKTDLYLAYGQGIIDSDYRGEISLEFICRVNFDSTFDNPVLSSIQDKANVYGLGDRIGQLIIIPHSSVTFTQVDELTKTERGQGGYGSTGR